jgi:hypothetical protein
VECRLAGLAYLLCRIEAPAKWQWEVLFETVSPDSPTHRLYSVHKKKRAVAEKYAVFQLLRNVRSGQNFTFLNILEIVLYIYFSRKDPICVSKQP